MDQPKEILLTGLFDPKMGHACRLEKADARSVAYWLVHAVTTADGTREDWVTHGHPERGFNCYLDLGHLQARNSGYCRS